MGSLKKGNLLQDFSREIGLRSENYHNDCLTLLLFVVAADAIVVFFREIISSTAVARKQCDKIHQQK